MERTMRARTAARWSLAFAVLALSLLAAPSHARLADIADVSQAGSQSFGDSADRAAIGPKTAANGLQMVGNFAYSVSGSNVTLTVDRIQNASTTRTSGTLRLELWATTTAPAREAAFT